MRGTARLLVPVAAMLLSGQVAPGHADTLCAEPRVGARLVGRYSLGPPVEQDKHSVESSRYPVTVVLPDNRKIRIIVTTPAALLAFGGVSYTLVVESPGIGLCVEDSGSYELFLGDLAVEPAGNAVPMLEIDVPPPAQAGPHRCNGSDRVLEVPDLPLEMVDVDASTNGCRHTLRIGPR